MTTRVSRTALAVTAASAVVMFSFLGDPRSLVAQPRPPTTATLRLEGTVEGRQQGVPACGILAVAGWVDFRIARVVAGVPPPAARVRLMVQCPESLRAARVYAVTAVSSRPRRGSWRMFSVLAAHPADGAPLYWALSTRERR